ncbi:MAG: InlB B-repeat-containing protein [Clostridiales Family XIII bacterium]|jgi:hypothetical protein|nr:InlB B-repeat-containing protein [Clostridiales Family XIII bacterium]
MILTFVPTGSATYADDEVSVWDGTYDISWYNTTATEFTLTSAAQFAGFAQIVNNKPNGSLAGAWQSRPEDEMPGIDEEAIITDEDADAEAIIADENTGGEPIIADSDTAAESIIYSGVLAEEPIIYGDDFSGKTVTLAVDVDLGAVQSSDGTWSGNEWPIIGKYQESGLHTAQGSDNGTTGRPFKGTFNGGFHEIYNLYEAGNTSGGVTGDSLSNTRGLFGDLGRDALVKNVVVKSGYVRGTRFVGGIVGRNWGHIENCINYATVETDGSRSGGGIAGVSYANGAAWTPYVKDSINFGTILTADAAYPGGIVGDNEGTVENCLNFGTGRHKTNPTTYKSGGIVGGGRGRGTVTNSYTLAGLMDNPIFGGGSGGTVDGISGAKTAVEMKDPTFAGVLNNGREPAVWVADSANRPTNNGYPVLAGQETANAAATFVTFAAISPPEKLSYQTGQNFDLFGFEAVAQYSDGTQDVVPASNVAASFASDYELTLEDTQVTINVTYGSHTGSFTYDLEVTQSALSSLALKTMPALTLYASGESFDPAGLAVTATYTSGKSSDIPAPNANLTFSPQTLSAGTAVVTASYTENGVTRTVEIPVTVLDTPVPSLQSEVYQFTNANDFRWFAARVNAGRLNQSGVKLVNDIDLSGVSYTPIGTAAQHYTGVFDGNGKTLTLNISGGAYQGVFGYIGSGGVVRDLTVAGLVSGTYNLGGIAGHSYGTIESCVNRAVITGSNCVGGITGEASSKTSVVRNCVNEGDVSGTAGNIGGIAGYATNAEISGVSNRGSVRGGATNVGGVVGYMSAEGTVTDSYNRGDIASSSASATARIGGIVGNVNGASATVRNTYNTGSLTYGALTADYGGVIGYAADTTNITNNYYLVTAANKDGANAVSKTDAELKGLAGVLGEAFAADNAPRNDGYPILAWERERYNRYEVTFDANGAADEFTGKVVYKGEAYGALPDIKRADYLFEGWFDKRSGGAEVTADTVFRGDADVVLYARWLKLGATEVSVIDGETDKAENSNVYDKYAQDKGFVFHIEGEFDPDVKVYIGMVKLTKNVDYTVTEGSTVITILPAALDRFAASDKPYTVEVEFTKIYDENGKQVNVKWVTQTIYIKDSAPKEDETQTLTESKVSNTGGGSVVLFTAKRAASAVSDTVAEADIAPVSGESDSLPSVAESPAQSTDKTTGDTASGQGGGISTGILIALIIAAALIGGGLSIFLRRRRTQS